MDMNFKVNVRGGIRTKLEVYAEATSVIQKKIRFVNGKEVWDGMISAWITKNLQEYLSSIEDVEL